MNKGVIYEGGWGGMRWDSEKGWSSSRERVGCDQVRKKKGEEEGKRRKKCEKEKEFAVEADGAEVVVKLFC